MDSEDEEFPTLPGGKPYQAQPAKSSVTYANLGQPLQPKNLGAEKLKPIFDNTNEVKYEAAEKMTEEVIPGGKGGKGGKKNKKNNQASVLSANFY